MSKEEEEKIISSLLFIIKMNKEQLEKATQDFTLSVFRAGCDSINFSILSMLPTNIDKIMTQFKITKMPVNRRVNELVRVGLAIRKKGSGEVLPTELTHTFLKVLKTISEGIKEQIPSILLNSFNHR